MPYFKIMPDIVVYIYNAHTEPRGLLGLTLRQPGLLGKPRSMRDPVLISALRRQW